MTIWTPELKTREGHPYQQLGAAIIDAINVGDLKPGERLPPQRDLAYALKISVGAVGRAYALARARGLLVGEVGRGTYVAGRNNRPSSDDFSSPGHQDTVMNLRRNLPPDVGQGTVLKELAQDALEDGENLFLDYNPSGGTLLQRSAGAQWLSRFGIVAPPDDVVVCAGVHQAMTIALLTATKPGDLIVCDHLTYMGIKQIAVMHQRRLEGLPMDAHGIIPGGAGRHLHKKKCFCRFSCTNLSESNSHAHAGREAQRNCKHCRDERSFSFGRRCLCRFVAGASSDISEPSAGAGLLCKRAF